MLFRTFIKIFILFFSFSYSQENVKPNIIIINCDDLGYGDLSSYGNKKNKTPNIDFLANKGQKWNHFYAAASVCTPSRAGLLTGKLPVRTGMYGDKRRVLHQFSEGGISKNEITIAELLKYYGYKTALIGKWHLGHKEQFLPKKHGFDLFYGIPYSNDMDRKPKKWNNWKEYVNDYKNGDIQVLDYKSYNIPLMMNEKIIERPVNQNLITSRFTKKTIEFIDSNFNKPFFIYLSHSMPHIPLFRSKPFKNISNGGIYGDVIEEIDWGIGEIYKQLKKRNLLENTLIIFTSDNGPWLLFEKHGGSPGNLKEGKGTTFEGGFRVPGIFYWENKIISGEINQIGSSLDLFNTVKSIIGDKKFVVSDDGFDLTPTLLKKERSSREIIYYYLGSELMAIRKGEFKLLINDMYIDGFNKNIIKNKFSLYNIINDPSESKNIIFGNDKLVEELLDELKIHKQKIVIKKSQLDLN